MLKILGSGVVGYQVTHWQIFLRGQGFLLSATGVFDEATEHATKAFQQRRRLFPDGVVGNQTYGKAALLGFEVVEASEADLHYPVRPAFAPLVGIAERQRLFGPLEFVPTPTSKDPERLRITNGWARANLVEVALPQLAGVRGAPASGKVWFHHRAAQQLQQLWQAWADLNLLHLVLTFEGTYNPRFVRGKAHQQILSNHAFGTAFDINFAWNRLGKEPATPDQTGCVHALVPVVHQFGFYWGGHFTRKDGMHFEIARLL